MLAQLNTPRSIAQVDQTTSCQYQTLTMSTDVPELLFLPTSPYSLMARRLSAHPLAEIVGPNFVKTLSH